MVFAISTLAGYFIIIGIVAVLCIVCYLIRRKLKLGTYTKEEEAKMKSNLDLLLKEEEIEEGKNYEDEV